MFRVFHVMGLMTLMQVSFIPHAFSDLFFKCEAGQWEGVTLSRTKDGQFQNEIDRVSLPLTVYALDTDSLTAYMLDGKLQTEATIQHTHSTYAVVTYVYGGVHYTDTIYTDGTVISQISKDLLGPRASIFQKQCQNLGEIELE